MTIDSFKIFSYYGSNPVALKDMYIHMYFFCVRRCRRPVAAADVNFLFENSMFFIISVGFWTIFEKRKGAFFCRCFSIVYCSERANMDTCGSFSTYALRFEHALKKNAPFQHVFWDFKTFDFSLRLGFSEG